jgi:hypothetical protein
MVAGGGNFEPASVSLARGMVSSSSSEVVELSSEERFEGEEGAEEESEDSESEREGRLLSVEGVVSLNGPFVLRLRAMIDDIAEEDESRVEGLTRGDDVG